MRSGGQVGSWPDAQGGRWGLATKVKAMVTEALGWKAGGLHGTVGT